jgi:DNA-binding transcriptional LysR family regulator
MNLRFLRTFCIVADKGSLAAAARTLGLANASVAEQIHSLEKSLGVGLTLRRGQTVVLTHAGRAVLDSVRSIVGEVDELAHIARAGALRGRLKVGSISTALGALLPATLRRLASSHPDIELKVVPGTSMSLLSMLEAGDIDCALMVKAPFALPKSFSWQTVRSEPLVLAAPPDMKGGIVSIIEAAPFIRMDRNAWTGQIVSRYLTDRHIQVRELFELDAPETIVTLVYEGLGVSLLPDWGITPPLGRDLSIVPVQDSRYSREIGILGRRGPATSLINAFHDIMYDSQSQLSIAR